MLLQTLSGRNSPIKNNPLVVYARDCDGQDQRNKIRDKGRSSMREGATPNLNLKIKIILPDSLTFALPLMRRGQGELGVKFANGS